jgi:hypothetical protein
LAAYELFNVWQRKKREEEALDFYSFWLDFSLQEKYVKKLFWEHEWKKKKKGEEEGVVGREEGESGGASAGQRRGEG